MVNLRSKQMGGAPRITTGLIMVIGIVSAVTFAKGTFWLPMMGDHCMKTSKSIQVAYNIVRYGDPFHKHVDFQASPTNLLGNRGPIIAYETPLSALSLAGLYAVLGGEDFERRVNIARYFTLAHLIGAYLLIGLLVLRRDPFALAIFTFTLFGATFTVSYATKPLPETYAIFYQGLFIAGGAHLLASRIGPLGKSVIIGALSALLAAGGKMNYFLIALPVIVAYPLFDSSLKGVRNKLAYFAIFLLGSGLAVLGVLIFTDFSFYKAFVFMIKGNKPIIDDSLYKTFIEGFAHFGDVVDRTRDDFGDIAFRYGKWGVTYLAAKLVFIAAFRRGEKSLWDRFSIMTALIAVGHAANYAVLRNLYIPHKYYVVPLYIIFCLAITILLADIRTLLVGDSPLKQRMRAWTGPKIAALSSRVFRSRDAGRAAEGGLLVAVFFGFLAVYAAYMGDTLASRGWQTTLLLTLKSFGVKTLAIDIRAAMPIVLDTLETIAIASACAAGLSLAAILVATAHRPIRTWLGRTRDGLRRIGVGIIPMSIVFALSFPATFWVLKNGKSFYHYAMSHTEFVEWAQDLARIRRDTTSGDLVLAWKVCVAFYADKRSITNATTADLEYYREHNIPSVMGPMRPLNLYYDRIEKYPPPMSYWVPKARAPENRPRDTQR